MLQEKRSLSTQLVQTQQVWHFAAMSEEPKDVRLPFMVTASEAKAIDEWRYKNKIPSRAEAMRLLINRGLILEEFSDIISGLSKIILERLKEDDNWDSEDFKKYAGMVNRHAFLVSENVLFEAKHSETMREMLRHPMHPSEILEQK
ncbi:hypothetical protein [Brucella pituitosa]|uniref:hypothetical protein n=1 Tax=Brucella pituitosa TaxID=571256 RepID=UPI000C27BA93|nr:hypothetical protein [Brucella pituitosa]PJO48928.1 hypothetical protein CWE02_03795 [Brucella pituitosa]